MVPSPAERRDFLNRWSSTLLLWRIPEVAFFVAFFLPSPVRPWVWLLSLAWAGGSCLANAVHCGRLHCWLTGPFFLMGAAALGLYLIAAPVLPAAMPAWIATAEIAGGLLLIFVPERLWGRYLARPRLAWLSQTSDRRKEITCE